MRDGAQYFTAPASSAQRRYEALRAYFLDEMPAAEVADRFGYSTASIHQMASLLRQGRLTLLAGTRPGPKGPCKATGQLRQRVLELRAGHSVTEIAAACTREGMPVSAQTCWQILDAEGLPRLPRRDGGRRHARLAGRAGGPAVRSRRAAAPAARHDPGRPAGPGLLGGLPLDQGPVIVAVDRHAAAGARKPQVSHAGMLADDEGLAPGKNLFARYAERMMAENELDAYIGGFHLDALTSGVPLNVDLDTTLTVAAGNLYQLLALKLSRYGARNPRNPVARLPRRHRHPAHQPRRRHLRAETCAATTPPSSTPDSPNSKHRSPGGRGAPAVPVPATVTARPQETSTQLSDRESRLTGRDPVTAPDGGSAAAGNSRPVTFRDQVAVAGTRVVA